MELTSSVLTVTPLSRGQDFPSFPLCRGGKPLSSRADNYMLIKLDPQADLNGGMVDSNSGMVAFNNHRNRVSRPGIIKSIKTPFGVS